MCAEVSSEAKKLPEGVEKWVKIVHPLRIQAYLRLAILSVIEEREKAAREAEKRR
jgi:hypothetical protein